VFDDIFYVQSDRVIFCLYFGFPGKFLRIKECVSIRVSNINDPNKDHSCSTALHI